MAAEMSCLTGVDEDDKDAEPEINAFTLLQEPVRMAQEEASCNNTFSKSPSEQNSVLDVLSNSDMLSSVGLGNGPSSHQATQAHELNSFSSEREETKSITPLKTVQEIDTAGIWGFDEDSPENSMDNFSGASDLHWSPHKDIMQFLWDSHGDSPGEGSKEEVSSANNRRRRKRKMDMVVMVDPSEDLYPELSPKSSEELSDSESQEDTSPVSKVQKPRMSSKSQLTTTAKVSKYPNGTVKTIKDRLYNGPTRNSHENSISHEISPLKKSLTVNSHSEEKPTCYPCSKCKLIFKKDHHLQRHMKSHVRVDPPDLSSKPFICRECGQSFRQSGSLIEHMSVHQEKRERLTEEIKSINNKRKEERKKLFCPQCTFVTQCPNTFVQHAKTHEKDKRKFRCDKCSFRFLSENELRRHNILQHTLITGKKQIEKDVSRMFSCNTCSYKATSKTVFRNHLLLRHEQTFEDYEAELRSEKKESPLKKQLVPTDKSPVEDAEITSKILIKDQIAPNGASSPSESSDISDLFKNNKIKTGPKSNFTESKLDKSINVLLSRQRHGKKTTEQKTESNNCSTSVQGSKSDKESSGHLQGTCEEVEKSDIIQNCNKEPSSPTKNYLNCRNVPNLANEHSPVKKSPSKRKMSTPYRNTSDQDSCFILPKPSPKKINQEEEEEEEEEDEEEDDGSDLEDREVFTYKDTDVIPNRFEKDIKKEKHIIYTYSRRMSMRGALQASKKLFEKIKTEEQEQGPDVTEIKEESIETDIIPENFEPHQIPLDESFSEDVLDLDIEMKSCPYCPAVFESGVGLSNHIRGHLHRAGVSYNERHAVPPEEVASHDKKPRIRRKMSALRRLKKALQNDSESDTVQSVHSCPLCGDSFDNRTGQSNHIRGHLKKLGKNFSKKSRSPLFVLRELMRDKKEYQRAIQILGRRRNHFQYGASKLSGYGFYRPMGFPRKNSIHSVNTEVEQRTHTFSLANMESDKRQPETKLDDKNSLSGTNALIGLLKKRKCQEEARLKGSSQMSKGTCAFSSSGEHCPGQRAASSLPKSSCEKGESNKVCVHCNATFHSGVSLSNHLRAYAKRKKNGIVDGTATECKIRRQRSRPGPKKKTQPLPQTPEEMYRLTCRFCDLVFQGPLSVQEDWVKHLQRHIMNTSVPHTGLGMVEVTSPPKTLRTDKDSSLMATNAAS